MPSFQYLKPRSDTEFKEADSLLHYYRKGAEIPLLEPGFWQVNRGVVQLSKISTSGDETILGWATANNSFGDFLTPQTNYRAQALSEAYLKWYSLSTLPSSPHRTRMLMTQLSQRLIKAQQLQTISRITIKEESLWQLLLLLKEEMGQSVVNGTRLTVRLTHENLAHIIGTTRVTVIKALGSFRKKGLISVDCKRHIIIRENKTITMKK